MILTSWPLRLLILFALLAGRTAYGQAPTSIDSLEVGQWSQTGAVNLNGSQVGLVNWAGGGQNAVSISSLANLMILKKNANGGWENNIELAYGLTRLENSPFGWEKSDDNIQWSSKYFIEEGEKWRYSALMKFRTQFDEGNDVVDADSLNEGPQQVKISDFLAPAYLNLSLGMEYQEGELFSVLLSPLSGKLTVVNDDALAAEGAYGVEPGRTTRIEVGAIFSGALRWVPMKNVRIESKLDLFSNYETPTTIDVNFENLIILKANEYLSTSITTNLIYDEDVDVLREDGSEGPATQFKEVVAVGFMYNF